MTRLEYHCSIQDNCLTVNRVLPETKAPQGLTISFRRTIRVPDNNELSKLPPDLGAFPLYKVHDYSDRLPQGMREKGGVFFPMHQKEAMWIKFKANAPFMIKIYCGGVNAVSGEHAAENAETQQRRLRRLERGELIQDYVVVPEQPWLDGVAIKPSVVRQFVAMPAGQGYTVESQLTGEEIVGGLQFEITPAFFEPEDLPNVLYVKTLTGKHFTIRCSPNDEFKTIKSRLYDVVPGLPPDVQRFVYAGKQMEDNRTLRDYNVPNKATLQLVVRLRGGSTGHPPLPRELGIAAGGFVEQDIRKDTRDPKNWVKGLNITMSVQILDSSTFRQATGLEPPKFPMDAETYASYGLPFFELHEENPTDVSGAEAFGALQSVNEIDTARGQTDGPEPVVNPHVTRLYERHLGTNVWDDGDVFRIEDPDGVLSPGGPRRAFRTLSDLEAEIRDLKLGTECD